MSTNSFNLENVKSSWLTATLSLHRDSFAYAKELLRHIRATKRSWPLPIILVANKIDLERARIVKREGKSRFELNIIARLARVLIDVFYYTLAEGRALAREFMCKFIEISCTVGYNLDNLLVGLRTQLVLKHHDILNPLLRHCKYIRLAIDKNQKRSELEILT